jgi:IS5 family transposase
VGPYLRGCLEGLRRRPADDRLDVDPCSPARRQRQGSEGEKKGAKAPAPTGDADDPRCVGRSRGGLTTKIHALVDTNGLPVALKLTPGQAHDGRSADDMLDTVGKGQTLIADAGYDSDRLRTEIKRRKAKCCIKPMPNRKKKCRPRKAFSPSETESSASSTASSTSALSQAASRSQPQTILPSSNSTLQEFGCDLWVHDLGRL